MQLDSIFHKTLFIKSYSTVQSIPQVNPLELVSQVHQLLLQHLQVGVVGLQTGQPLGNTVLQDTLGPQLTVLNRTVQPMHSDALLVGKVLGAVQNVVVVENNVTGVHLHGDLASDVLLAVVVSGLLALLLGADPLVRARHDNEAGVLGQGKVELGTSIGVLQQLLGLLLRSALGLDGVAVPVQTKVSERVDQHVEQFHQQLVVRLLQDVQGNVQDLVARVQVVERLQQLAVLAKVWVQQTQHTPDVRGKVFGPRGKLLATSAHIGPLALASVLNHVLGSLLVLGDLLRGQEASNDGEALVSNLVVMFVG